MTVQEKIEVDVSFNHIQRKDDSLFADSSNGTTDQQLIVFDLSDGIKEVKRVNVEMDNRVYISSIFHSE